MKRSNRPKLAALAAWLGVVALCLNALVPVHLAFDLADAVAPHRHGEAGAAGRQIIDCLLTLVAGHHHDDDEDGNAPSRSGHHHDVCAVAAAIGTLAGTAPAGAVGWVLPDFVYLSAFAVVDLPALHSAAAAAYHSRAPPRSRPVSIKT